MSILTCQWAARYVCDIEAVYFDASIRRFVY